MVDSAIPSGTGKRRESLTKEEYERFCAESREFMNKKAYDFKNSSFGHKFNV